MVTSSLSPGAKWLFAVSGNFGFFAPSWVGESSGQTRGRRREGCLPQWVGTVEGKVSPSAPLDKLPHLCVPQFLHLGNGRVVHTCPVIAMKCCRESREGLEECQRRTTSATHH